MKIVLTGSLGHITRPLAINLIKEGHQITIISSNSERQKEIEALGAVAAIGDMHDATFLTHTFKGVDVVYCMVPYPDIKKSFQEIVGEYTSVAENYKAAVLQTGISKMVILSSVGAHMPSGNGLLQYAYAIEQAYNQLPEHISIKFMRPVSFYYNLLSFIPVIKSQGVIATSYGGDTKKPWVSPIDIATTTAAAILSPFEGRTFQYIASEMLSCNEIAALIGTAIGKPQLQWITVPDETVLNTFIKLGMEPSTAQAFTDMNIGIQNGSIYADYYKHQPELGQTKMADYVKEFAQIYQQ
ncbi:NmrA family NAD(P)-binding protein [Arachidicoccus ginsenosidivorans]